MDTKVKLYKTKDGSNTLFHLELNEIYHSRNGAISESLHVFIKYGLQYLIDKKYKEINIFEMGFGTGLNAILTYKSLKDLPVSLFYNAIDVHPLDWNTVKELEYHEHSLLKPLKTAYKEIIDTKWGFLLNMDDKFKFLKEKINIYDLSFSSQFDLIFYDAFAPSVQPELWTLEIFKKMYKALNINGVIVTYCAKGEIRRNLQKAGFMVEKLPGPPGKREMLRGIKQQ